MKSSNKKKRSKKGMSKDLLDSLKKKKNQRIEEQQMTKSLVLKSDQNSDGKFSPSKMDSALDKMISENTVLGQEEDKSTKQNELHDTQELAEVTSNDLKHKTDKVDSEQLDHPISSEINQKENCQPKIDKKEPSEFLMSVDEFQNQVIKEEDEDEEQQLPEQEQEPEPKEDNLHKFNEINSVEDSEEGMEKAYIDSEEEEEHVQQTSQEKKFIEKSHSQFWKDNKESMQSLYIKLTNEKQDKEFLNQENKRKENTIQNLKKEIKSLEREKLELKMETDKEKAELTNLNNKMEREKIQLLNFSQKIKSITAMSLQLNSYFIKKSNLDFLNLK